MTPTGAAIVVNIRGAKKGRFRKASVSGTVYEDPRRGRLSFLSREHLHEFCDIGTAIRSDTCRRNHVGQRDGPFTSAEWILRTNASAFEQHSQPFDLPSEGRRRRCK